MDPMRKRQMIRKRMHDTENKNKKSTYAKAEEIIILNDLPKKHVHGMHGSTLVYMYIYIYIYIYWDPLGDRLC